MTGQIHQIFQQFTKNCKTGQTYKKTQRFSAIHEKIVEHAKVRYSAIHEKLQNMPNSLIKPKAGFPAIHK